MPASASPPDRIGSPTLKTRRPAPITPSRQPAATIHQPTAPCSAATAGQQQTVNYQADYIFWRAAPAVSVQNNPLYSRS